MNQPETMSEGSCRAEVPVTGIVRRSVRFICCSPLDFEKVGRTAAEQPDPRPGSPVTLQPSCRRV